MPQPWIEEKLSVLSQALAFAEPGAPQALAEIHGHFQELAQWSGGQPNPPLIASAAGAAADLLQKIIMEETEDAAASLLQVSQTAAAIQSVLMEGASVEQAGFPEYVRGPGASTDTQSGGAKRYSLPDNADEAILAEFLTKQPAMLESYEELVMLQEKREDDHALAEFKRLVHTLKGESGLLGMDEISRLCHAIEDAMASRPVGSMIDSLLGAKDWLEKAYAFYAGTGEEPRPIQELLELFETTPSHRADESTGKAASAPTPVPAPVPEPTPAACEADSPMRIKGDRELVAEFLSEARDHLDNADVSLLTLETDPKNGEAINALFRSFHTIKGVSGFLELEYIRGLAHEAENLLDACRQGKRVFEGVAIDVIFEAVDCMKRLVAGVEESLTGGSDLVPDPDRRRIVGRIQAVMSGKSVGVETKIKDGVEGTPLGRILVQSGMVREEDLRKLLIEQPSRIPPEKLGEMLVKAGLVSAQNVAHALRIQQGKSASTPAPKAPTPEPATRQERTSTGEETARSEGTNKAVKVKETVKVDAERLDELVEAIGELVIAEAMVSQSDEWRGLNLTRMPKMLNHLDKITRELQGMAMGLRMVPLRSTFQRMARLARDVAKKLGKKVDFVTVGEDAELDKSVVDQIGDPLVHMVRNAIDHGLEGDEADRIKAGKPAAGRVTLSASHKGGSIVIEIRDDGRGLNREVLLAKAREKGLIQGTGDGMSESQVYALLMEPGFSTAEKITDVSGRGVGMDVVKKTIQSLRGQVEIKSQLGQGTTFIISLPLTLAIIEGIVVRIGGQRYIIPTLSILRMLQPGDNEISTIFNRGEVLTGQDKTIPLVRLHDLFNVKGAVTDPRKGTVVVVEEGSRQAGLLVDGLLGQHQIVIKPLGNGVVKSQVLSGGAIMPDGRVGLVLDVAGLLNLAGTEHLNRRPAA